jgi:hypothetical protein
MTFQSSPLVRTAAIVLIVSGCLSQPSQYEEPQPTDGPAGSTGRPGSGPGGGGSGVGGTGLAGLAGAGGAGGVGAPGAPAGPVDADRPVDAEQPVGGCGSPARSCAGNVLQVCNPDGKQSTPCVPRAATRSGWSATAASRTAGPAPGRTRSCATPKVRRAPACRAPRAATWPPANATAVSLRKCGVTVMSCASAPPVASSAIEKPAARAATPPAKRATSAARARGSATATC